MSDLSEIPNPEEEGEEEQEEMGPWPGDLAEERPGDDPADLPFPFENTELEVPVIPPWAGDSAEERPGDDPPDHSLKCSDFLLVPPPPPISWTVQECGWLKSTGTLDMTTYLTAQQLKEKEKKDAAGGEDGLGGGTDNPVGLKPFIDDDKNMYGVWEYTPAITECV
jgi:hypothetical protein